MRQVLALRSGEHPWSTAIRSGLAFAVPAAIAAGTGHSDAMFLVIAGAFAVLFGTGAYRTRARTVSLVALILVLSAAGAAALGWHLSDPGPPAELSAGAWMVAVAALCLYSALACFLIAALRLRAGVATFPVMITGSSLLAHRFGFTVTEVIIWAAVGGISAIVFAVIGWVLDPAAPQRGAVRRAARAVATYRETVRGGSSGVHQRHLAAVACQDAWLVLAGAGAIRGGHITARRRRFRGLVRELGLRRSTSPAAGFDPDPTERAAGGPAELPDTPDTRSITALLATQAQLRQTVLSERTDRHRTASALHDEPDLPRGGATTIPVGDPSGLYRLRVAATTLSPPAIIAIRVLVAALLAGGLSIAVGLTRPDWAIITVVVLLGTGTAQRTGTIRGIHRALGTCAGLGIFLVIWWSSPGVGALVILIGLCQALVELLIVRNYALAITFATPLALVAGGAIHQDDSWMVSARFLEVLIAVIISLGCLWWVIPHGSRATFLSATRLSHRRTGELLGLLADRAPATLLEERRILRHELIGAARTGVDAAHDAPTWMRHRWAAHDVAQEVGFRTLALADSRTPERLTPTADLADCRRAWEDLPVPE